jgi:hypothetical protein
MVKTKEPMKAQPPMISRLYSKYENITLDHCKTLLIHLYEGKLGSWVNPITGNTINNSSYITISFLSKCYYIWGNKSATINSKKLKYKKHIEKFIAKEYLFDIPSIKSLAELRRDEVNADDKLRKKKELGKRGKRGGVGSPPHKLTFDDATINISRKMIKSEHNYLLLYDELDLEKCVKFVDDIVKTKKDETTDDLRKKGVYLINPVRENDRIAFGSSTLLIYLSKCNTFEPINESETINKKIREMKNKISNLVDVDKLIKLTDENEKRLAIPIIDGKLNEYIEKFNTFLDKLKDNCNANGILKDHIHISNIVNAIIVIICTKYLHLYDEITPTTYDNPLQIYMYDDTIDYDNFKENYNGKIINDGAQPITTRTIYQKDDLMQTQTHTLIDLKPKTIDKYKENTLFNRQYVFELSKKDTEMNIKYNMINNRTDTFEQTFDPNKLATTLGYAYELLFNKNPFNYNITNSTLPKKINIECSNPSVLSHFDKILNEINTKLENLQIVINDVRSKSEKYNSVIFDMKLNGFGYNDMIRKNILYSLNAQNPSYIELYKVGKPITDFYKDEIYYNYGYTGSFPIFTWIPISQSGDASATDAYYNFPSSFIWQPYGADNTDKFIIVEKAYKNYYTRPFSKLLNETIYKVISEESTIVDTDMMKRINETIGIYKDMDRVETYKNKKIYLYHGTNTKLHNMDGKLDDIELLGFLSTTLNVYAASFYSEAALMKSRDGGSYGYIYIIEVDDEQKYINLNDNLYQFILLPHSIIRILYTFDYMGIKIILCRLIKTPTKEKNNELYKKLFDNAELASAKVAFYYFIKQNANDVPICAGFLKPEDFKKAQQIIYNRSYVCITKIKSDYMDIFQIPRALLMSAKLPTDNKLYVYFSLLQENELYLTKDKKTKGVYGGFDDIKYSIHQHFIKDCYKSLEIPCIDYAFLHGNETTNNNIATGILLDDYENNRKYEYKYDINNFLIDCIFNFDSINNENKKLDLQGVDNGSDVSDILYADKIEGFRNAGLYINGTINRSFYFDIDEQLEYILENVKKYRSHLFKYSEAGKENLAKHFECCNKKFEKLMGIIDNLKEQYLKFINDILQANPVSNSSMEKLYELNMMLNHLADTLKERAKFQFLLTRTTHVADFIKQILEALEPTSDAIANEIPLPRDAKFADLILSDDEAQRGGKHSKKNKVKVVRSFVDNLVMKRIEGTDIKGVRKSSGTKREEVNKEINASISQYTSLYKFEDLPKSFQEYYGKRNKGNTIDISNGCHVRMIPRKDY